MRSLLAPLAWSSSLLVIACSSGEQAPSAVEARLAAIDDRLATIESRLDGVSNDLSIVVEHVRAEQEEQAKRKAEREAAKAEHEAARAEREQRRRALDDMRRPAWSGEEGQEGEDPTVPPSREIEGAAEGIQCREVSPTNTACTVDRALVDHVVADPSQLSRQARIVPAVRDGKVLGYKFYGIRRGSLPKLLGMENGDLLISINGMTLDSIDAAMDVYTKLRRETRFELDIERRGAPFRLDIEIIE